MNTKPIPYTFYVDIFFRIEVFDSDKVGKDKSLGKLTIDPRELDSDEPQWFPLQV